MKDGCVTADTTKAGG